MLHHVMEDVLKVEIWFDVVCPWCYIGKRNLEAALAVFEHGDEVDVVSSYWPPT